MHHVTLAAVLLAATLGPSGPAAAQQIGVYYATISDTDRRNSRGAALSDPGAILQQDRANYHRFGRADIDDEGDPFFGDPDLRARIPALYAAGSNDAVIDNAIRLQGSSYLLIFVCGRGGRPTHLNVYFSDGDSDDHMVC
jgi:hypothetical protein